MTEITRHERAFVRPSPSGGDLGGLARRSRDSVLLTEAAGFDVVIVETVGVGQSEVEVAGVVDTFVLLVAAGAGDELQGVKRGVIELADIVVVTKADSDLRDAATRAVGDYRSALALLRRKHPGWQVPVLATSAVDGTGIPELWDAVRAHRAALDADGSLVRLRDSQARAALHRALEDRLIDELRRQPGAPDELAAAEEDVAAGRLTPEAAVERLIDGFLGPR